MAATPSLSVSERAIAHRTLGLDVSPQVTQNRFKPCLDGEFTIAGRMVISGLMKRAGDIYFLTNKGLDIVAASQQLKWGLIK